MLDAYDLARLAGFSGSLLEFYKKTYAEHGYDGLKASGYPGDKDQAQKTLKGAESALSAYDLACQHGFKGTPSEYVKSLKGLDGLDAFDVAVKSGFSGTQSEWLRSLQGDKGLDAFESAVAKGFDGDLAQWLESLRGLKGDTGPMPEHQWIGTSLQFERPDGAFGVAVDLVGPRGDKGDNGDDGKDGRDGEMPNHQIDGQRIRFEKPGGGFGAWVDLGRDRSVSSGGGGSLSLQKFHDGVDDFPTPGKKQILYFDTSVSPYGAFIWDGQKYEQIGGGGADLEISLSGLQQIIEIPTSIRRINGVSVRKNTGEVVSVAVKIGKNEILIDSNVDLVGHTAFVF